MTLSKDKLVALYSLYKEGHFEQVLQQCNALLEEFSTDISLLKILAASNIGLGRLDVAIEHYKIIINLNPMDAEGYNSIGVAYKKKGDISVAIESYQQAVNLNPDYAAAYMNLGTALQEKGDAKKAIEIYQRVIELTPENPRAYNSIGVAYLKEDNIAAAIKNYRRAIEISPDLAIAHNNLGAALYKEGYIDQAIETYNHALQLQPDDPNTHANLGAALADKRYHSEAIESYKHAIKLKSDVSLWHYLLGVIFAENEDTKSAFKYLYNSLELDPDFAEAHHAIGLIYYKLQKYGDALAAFDRSGSVASFAQSLLCLHAQRKHNEFTERIKSNLDKYKNNIEVAAMCAFTYNQINEENIHPFCKNPLEFIYSSSLNHHEENSHTFINVLLEELKKEPSVWTLRKKSAEKGFHTTGNLFSNSCGAILNLEKLIKKEIELYYSKFKSNSCGFIELWPKNILLNGWSIRLQKDGFQLPHHHRAGWLSGVIYLQLVESENKDEGAIEFSLCGADYIVLNEHIPTFRYHPNPGDIILFPSSLFHYTIPIRNEGERVIVSFDLLPN